MERYYLWAAGEEFEPVQIMDSHGYATLQEAKHVQDRIANSDLSHAPLFQRVWIMKATEIKDEVQL